MITPGEESSTALSRILPNLWIRNNYEKIFLFNILHIVHYAHIHPHTYIHTEREREREREREKERERE